MTERPKRIQLRRTKGWRKPSGAVVVARPTRWGNPVALDSVGGDRAAAVECYRRWLRGDLPETPTPPSTEDIVRELRGRDLACWCPLDRPCHADVLLEVANQ